MWWHLQFQRFNHKLISYVQYWLAYIATFWKGLFKTNTPKKIFKWKTKRWNAYSKITFWYKYEINNMNSSPHIHHVPHPMNLFAGITNVQQAFWDLSSIKTNTPVPRLLRKSLSFSNYCIWDCIPRAYNKCIDLHRLNKSRLFNCLFRQKEKRKKKRNHMWLFFVRWQVYFCFTRSLS